MPTASSSHEPQARMATFWGQQIDPSNHTLVMSDSNWHQNWITHRHNNLRMTRVLVWLKAFGMEAEYNMMLKYLDQTATTNEGFKPSLDNFCKPEPLFYANLFQQYKTPL